MENIDKSKLIIYDKEQKMNQTTSTKIVIITSGDNDNDKLLSYLNPSNIETFVVDINTSNLMNVYQTQEKDVSIDIPRPRNRRKRTADLTCVVCGGEAIGYNFGQISCESCKAFFRRNALNPIEKTKCAKYKDNSKEIRCDIHNNIKRKCQRCRLLKCFQAGMDKDFILTPEQLQTKKRRLEENRLLRFTTNNNIKSEPELVEPIPIPIKTSLLTDYEWSCLSYIQNAYLSASLSTPSASSMISLELAPDTMSAFMNTIDIQNFAAVKLITFLRDIPEFQELDEHDRIILIKYNLTLLFLLRHTLSFDSVREICYDLDTPDVISPTEEAFAHQSKSLFILCYGYEFNRAVMSTLHILTDLTKKDPIIIQLLMLIMIFSKGISADDDQEPVLNETARVLNAQSKYTDLLYRYLMENSSYESTVVKITRITEQLFKIQKLLRDYQQYIKNKVDVTYINPLMRSLLHLT